MVCLTRSSLSWPGRLGANSFQMPDAVSRVSLQTAAGRKSPLRTRRLPRTQHRRRRLDRRAKYLHVGRIVEPELAPRFGKAEVHGACSARKHARGHTRMAVRFVQNRGHTMRTRPRQRDPRRIPTRPDDRDRPLQTRQFGEGAPRSERPEYGAVVPVRRAAIQGVQFQQRVRKLGGGQHLAFDAAPCPDEVGRIPRVETDQCPRDGEPRIQMATGATTGKPDRPRWASRLTGRPGTDARRDGQPTDPWPPSRTPARARCQCSREFPSSPA